MKRVYCDGPLTRELLVAKLAEGLVCTDFITHGWSGGDIAYFREGTPPEVQACYDRMGVTHA